MAFWEFKFDVISFPFLLELILRIFVSGICGAVVGYERSKRLKEAGLRTHCVVAMASALIMIISKYGFVDVLRNGGFVTSVDIYRCAFPFSRDVV